MRHFGKYLRLSPRIRLIDLRNSFAKTTDFAYVHEMIFGQFPLLNSALQDGSLENIGDIFVSFR